MPSRIDLASIKYSWRSRLKCAMTMGALILVAVLLATAGYLFAISPGRPSPLRDALGNVIPGSISERVTVQIGGIPQSMIIQSADPANPVFLFLHGGPGMPEFFMELDHPTGLERHFTMVWWNSAERACRSRLIYRLKP